MSTYLKAGGCKTKSEYWVSHDCQATNFIPSQLSALKLLPPIQDHFLLITICKFLLTNFQICCTRAGLLVLKQIACCGNFINIFRWECRLCERIVTLSLLRILRRPTRKPLRRMTKNMTSTSSQSTITCIYALTVPTIMAIPTCNNYDDAETSISSCVTSFCPGNKHTQRH